MKLLYSHRYIVVIIISVFTLSSCLSTKRANRFVNESFPATRYVLENDSDFFSVKFCKEHIQVDSVGSEKIKSYFLPLIFYWGLKNQIKTTLPDDLHLSLFRKAIKESPNYDLIKEKLRERHLNIELEIIPSSFVYDHHEDAVVLVFVYFFTGNISIIPDTSSVVLRYSLSGSDLPFNEERMVFKSNLRPVMINMSSNRMLYYMYLSDYNETIKKAANGLMLDLYQQL